MARGRGAVGVGTSLERRGHRHELAPVSVSMHRLLLRHQADVAEHRRCRRADRARVAHGAPRRRGSPHSSRSTVDLPAPLGPSSAVTPGPSEGHVGHGHDAAEPLRDAVELDGRARFVSPSSGHLQLPVAPPRDAPRPPPSRARRRSPASRARPIEVAAVERSPWSGSTSSNGALAHAEGDEPLGRVQAEHEMPATALVACSRRRCRRRRSPGGR